MDLYGERTSTANGRCEEFPEGHTDPANAGLRFEIIGCESENKVRERQVAEQYGLKRSNGHACIDELRGMSCCGDCPSIPVSCGPSLWQKNGFHLVISSQPEGLTEEGLRQT